MKKILVQLDDETASLLADEKNMSETVRESVKYMKLYITPDTLEGMRKSYAQLTRLLKDMDSKLDYLVRLIQKEPS